MSYQNDNWKEKERLENLSSKEIMKEAYPGWSDIIESSFSQAEEIIKNKKNKLQNKKDISKEEKTELNALKNLDLDEIFYMKEKYWYLDLTTNFSIPNYEELQDIIIKAYEKSSETCQICWKDWKIRWELSWFKALCDKHFIKEAKKEIEERDTLHTKKLKKSLMDMGVDFE